MHVFVYVNVCVTVYPFSKFRVLDSLIAVMIPHGIVIVYIHQAVIQASWGNLPEDIRDIYTTA